MRLRTQLGKSAYAGLVGFALLSSETFGYDKTMLAGKKPLFVLQQNCLVITERIIQEVKKAGMQTMRSFDLDLVRASSQSFCCPIHGTSGCTCQLVILLILMRERGYVTLILEGSDRQTSVYLDTGQGAMEEQVDLSLTAALSHAFFSI